MGASGDTYQPHSPYKLLLLQYFHWAHNPKVVGSNPAPATKTIKRLCYYSVAVFSFSLLNLFIFLYF